VNLVLADAQHLPFRDGVFDAAAATFVFCSVPNPVAGLEEVRRVVRDKGRIHLLEHVRAANPIIGRIMDLLKGANINRETASNVAKAQVNIDSVESRGFGIVKVVRGSVSGSASQESKSEVSAKEAI
jgi:ubiquinone/menaquinone biosynthesis C-methylase UbiE